MSEQIVFERGDDWALHLLGLEPDWSGENGSAVAIMGIHDVYQAALGYTQNPVEVQLTETDKLEAADTVTKYVQELGKVGTELAGRIAERKELHLLGYQVEELSLIIDGLTRRQIDLEAAQEPFAHVVSAYYQGKPAVLPGRMQKAVSIRDAFEAIGADHTKSVEAVELEALNQEAARLSAEHLAAVQPLAQNRVRLSA